MGLKHNHLAVIGRLHGDDEGTIRLYAGMTESEARQRFGNDLRRDAGVRETDVHEQLIDLSAPAQMKAALLEVMARIERGQFFTTKEQA